MTWVRAGSWKAGAQGPGILPPLLTSLFTERLSPEKLHRRCGELRLQDLQWPCDGTAPVCDPFSVCICARLSVYMRATVNVCAHLSVHRDIFVGMSVPVSTRVCLFVPTHLTTCMYCPCLLAWDGYRGMWLVGRSPGSLEPLHLPTIL